MSEGSQKRFRGRSETTLNEKGRLNFPSRFRKVVHSHESNVLMITTWGKYLRAYSESEWEKLEDKLRAKGRENPKKAGAIRIILSGVNECSVDKQGRLLIPVYLRNAAGLGKDIMLAGMTDWVEIWDKEAWDAEHETAIENFDVDLADLGFY